MKSSEVSHRKNKDLAHVKNVLEERSFLVFRVNELTQTNLYQRETRVDLLAFRPISSSYGDQEVNWRQFPPTVEQISSPYVWAIFLPESQYDSEKPRVYVNTRSLLHFYMHGIQYINENPLHKIFKNH